MPTWEDVFYQREAWRQQVGENSARLAFAWGTVTTTGTGQSAHEDIIMFGLAFAEKPMVSYGFELTNRTDFEDDDDITTPLVPSSSGCVYMWEVDGRGMYVGAHVALSITADVDTELEHHFGFTGLAIKDVSSGTKPGD